MKNRHLISVFVLVILLGCSAKETQMSEIKPQRGDITVKVSVTGSVMPQNRLQIKPSVAGRIERIFVAEGDYVKAGQKVAEMSSQERAALLDAAKSGGTDEIKKWEEVYKPIPLIAPLSGTVIVKGVEPGQAVTQSDAVIVLSDRLIVQASVDETDIGKIKRGQEAAISLDAYPDRVINAAVNHISYESTTVNNVTMYTVDILPKEVPDFFRSGMSANVDIISSRKDGVMLLPSDAVSVDENGRNFVIVRGSAGKPEKLQVETGVTENGNTEIISGIDFNTSVLVSGKGYVVNSKKNDTSSPFMPKRPNMRGNRR